MTTATGFYEQKTLRPGGLALVVALHAAAFAGLVMAKTDIVREQFGPTRLIDVFTPPPPPDAPPPPPSPRTPQSRSVLDAPVRILPLPPTGPTVSEPPAPPQPPTTPPGPQTVLADATPDLPHVPVRTEVQFDPRFARELQPPYPPAEEAAQREGDVRVRITVGPDGRVRAIECLSATRDVFCRATERHGRSHWRFRPATVDGRPVESTKTMNIMFRIQA
jgi:protein TonB